MEYIFVKNQLISKQEWSRPRSFTKTTCQMSNSAQTMVFPVSILAIITARIMKYASVAQIKVLKHVDSYIIFVHQFDLIRRQRKGLCGLLEQIFYYTCCITLKRVTSLRSPQLLSMKYRNGGKPLVALCSIQQAQDLNLRPYTPSTNA